MIKYKYALNALSRIISIQTISEKDRGDKYYCPSCGEILRPRLGVKRTHHFYHSQCSDINGCGLETYLHNVTKRLLYAELKDRFYNEMPYYFSAYNLIKLIDDNDKLISTKYDVGYSEYNILEACKNISLEKYIGEFKPDISVEYFDKEPLFLEIQVHHKSRWTKRDKNTIIEICVRDENDIERVQDHLEEQNDEAYNFDNFRKIIVEKQRSRHYALSNTNKTAFSSKEQYSLLSDLRSCFISGKCSAKIEYEVKHANHDTPINKHAKIFLNDFYKEGKLVKDNFDYVELASIGGKKKLLIGFDERIKEKAIACEYMVLQENTIKDGIIDQCNIKETNMIIDTSKLSDDYILKVSCFIPKKHFMSKIIELRYSELKQHMDDDDINIILIEEIRRV